MSRLNLLRISKTLSLYGIITVLVLTPLAFNLHVFLAYDVPKNNVLYILVPFISIGFVLFSIFSTKSKHDSSAVSGMYAFVSLIVLGFLGIMYLASILGADWQQSFWGGYWRKQGIIVHSFYIIIFFITREMFSSGLKPQVIAKAITFSSFSCALYAGYQGLHYYILKDATMAMYKGRLTGTFSNPNLLAGFLVLTVPFGIYLLKTTKSKVMQIVYIGYLLFLSIVCLLTFSKSFVLVFLMLGFLYALFTHSRYKYIYLGLGLLVSFVFLKYVILSSNSIFLRTSYYENRTSIWQNALEAIHKKPLLGYGWENFDYAMQDTVTREDISIYKTYIDRAHNELLHMAVTLGLLGLGAFLAILITAYTRGLRLYKQTSDRFWAQALLISLTVFLVFSQFNFYLTAGYLYFWVILAGIFALEPKAESLEKK